MRTNIEIDDQLLEEAMRVTGIKTKKELIARALQELITNRKKMDLRMIKGKIDFRDDYNYIELRKS